MTDYPMNIRKLEAFVSKDLEEMGFERFEAVEDDTKDVEFLGDIYTSTHIVTVYVDYDQWVEWWGNPDDATNLYIWQDVMVSQYDFVIEAQKVRIDGDSIEAVFYFTESY